MGVKLNLSRRGLEEEAEEDILISERKSKEGLEKIL
jgi:hypothetical protein